MPFCKNCGREQEEGDRYCKQCGAVQQPEALQTPMAPVRPSPGKFPLYILIGVLSLLALAGLIVGIVLLVRESPEARAVEGADKYVAEALGYMDEVDAMEDDLFEETRDLDFSIGAEKFQVQVEGIQKKLEDATVKLEAAAASLEKIDRPNLPDWWDTYVSLLDKAYQEKIEAYKDWNELIDRLAELDEFNQAYQEMVNLYNEAITSLDQAFIDYDAGCADWGTAAAADGYESAKYLADYAFGKLAEVRTQLEKMSRMEPEIDFSSVLSAVTQLEDYIALMNSASDSGIAGNLDAHYPQCMDLRAAKDTLPRTISFDIAAWIASIRDQYIEKIEEHLAKEAEYRRRAARVWAENN